MDAPLAVLNPGGRDKFRAFPQGAGTPGEAGHPPVNYHAYAACDRGAFCQVEREIPEAARAVLVLLRKNGFDDALRAVHSQKKAGRKVFIALKECGSHQVAEALGDGKRLEKFREICRAADAYISSGPYVSAVYEAAGCRVGEFLATPYPIEEDAWDFSRPVADRAGIFVGTREFGVPSRNHLQAVMLAASLGHPVTVINTDGGAGERMLRAISPNIRVVNGLLDYPEYLDLMARHRLVFQLDRSAVPGQVAGDALLCRLPCVGGDGAVDRLAFAPLCGGGSHAVALAARLLQEDDFYREELNRSMEAALQALSFSVVAARLLALAG